MVSNDDVVVLDGYQAIGPTWPVEEAEALLADPTPWGVGPPPDRGPNQMARFCRLAGWVNAYLREGAMEKARSIFWAAEPEVTYERHTTQLLLDALFFSCRADHFNYGAIKAAEPELRAILQEVVRRVRSEHPPTFVLPPKDS
jgi:hypothetical protein